MPNAPKFHQDDAVRGAPDRETCLEYDVRPGLAGRAGFRIIVPVCVFRAQRNDVIRSPENNHRLRSGSRPQSLVVVRDSKDTGGFRMEVSSAGWREFVGQVKAGSIRAC